jgi:hypothetical protein
VNAVLRLLAFIFVFAAVVAAVYWYVTYEPAGTVLLAFLALMPLVVAAWLVRHRRVEGRQALADRPDARPEEAAGEVVGSFLLGSVWPLVLTLGTVVLGAGLIYGVLLVPPGLAIMAAAILGMMRQSRPRA